MASAHRIDLITLSREYGSGGRELAEALGTRLGWYVLDYDLTTRVADRLQLKPDVVERMDEHPPGLLARIASALLVPMPESPITVDTSNVLDPDAVAHAVREEILSAVKSPPLIVVGHGTQCLFHDRVGTFHVRVMAPMASRVARLEQRYGWGADRAATQARELDAARTDYVRRYYNRDIRDPLLYDLQVNTNHISIDEAARMISMYVSAHR
jgi:hypothetical protein